MTRRYLYLTLFAANLFVAAAGYALYVKTGVQGNLNSAIINFVVALICLIPAFNYD